MHSLLSTLITNYVLFGLLSCSSNETSGSDSLNKMGGRDSGRLISNHLNDTVRQILKSNAKADSLNTMLRGVWTDGSLEGATLDIGANTIYYVDQGASYNYTLNQDMLTIAYPDYSYEAKITLQGDTLIMDSKEYGQSKFWKFKN